MSTHAKMFLTALGILALGLATANTAAANEWTRSLNGDNDTTVDVIDAINKAYPARQANGNGSYAYRQRGNNDMTVDVIDAIARDSRIGYPVANGNFAYTQPGDNDMTVAVIDAINRDRQAPAPVRIQAPSVQAPVFAGESAPANDSFAQGRMTEYNG